MSAPVPFCRDCAHRTRWSTWCAAPQLGRNPVTGRPRQEPCWQVRCPDGGCEPEGRWFTPKPARRVTPGDALYSIHGGPGFQHGAELRLSDCQRAATVLKEYA